MNAFALWVEGSPVAQAMQSSVALYAAALTLHLLAMVVIVGTGLVLDVRLIGWTNTPLPALVRWLTPAQIVAGTVAVLTGLMLFSPEAASLLRNEAFQAKMVLLALMFGNALGFTFGARRRLSEWSDRRRPPGAARASGWIALLGWPAAVVAARLIAFA